MKNMRKYILLLCTLCLGLVSCVKENMTGVETDGLTTFKAVYADASTKTVLEGLTPMWTPEDKISIFDGKNNMFTNSLSGKALTAEFKGKLEGQGSARDNFIAAYPYNEEYTCNFVGSFVGGMQVPAEQTAIVGTYDPSAAPAVAYTTSSELSFYNAYSLVKFTIVSDGVKEVSLVGNDGETLAGKMNVAKENPLRITVTKAEAKVTLKGDFKNGSTYYMTTAPAVLKSGITVTLKNAAGESVESMKYTGQVALERSGIVNLGNLSLDPKESVLPDTPGNEDEPEEGMVYFKPAADWTANGAHIAAYFWQEGMDETWVDLVEDTEAGVFKCEVPAGYSNIIFVSIKAGAANNWDNKLYQTVDLTVPAGSDVCFVPTGMDAEGKATGEWTSYPPAGVEPNPGTPGGDVETVGTVYLRPNSNWLEANARFAAYLWQTGKPEVWVSLTEDVEANVYKCDVPEGYSNIIFVRMNPDTSVNSWDDGVKWGQTADLLVPEAGSSNICYVITPGTWGEDGYWTTYPPVVTEPDPTPDPTPDPDPTPEPDPTPDPGTDPTPEAGQVRIYLSTAWGWPYIWCWDSNAAQIFAGANWPGTRYHGEENGYYYWNVPESYVGQTVSLLAVKEDMSEQTSDFNDVVLDKSVYFYLEWTSEKGCHLIQENR